MTDDTDVNAADDESDEQTLELTYRLDGPHATMCAQLRAADVSVEDVCKQQTQQAIEQALYKAYQASKYRDQEGR